jgi:hypothetical protein
MGAELDHLFVWVACDGKEAEKLKAFGLSEGTPNEHPGQGTACRRFFFDNAYLELLWVSDPTEAQSSIVRPIHLWERWIARRQGACPFGFVFRPDRDAHDLIPFPASEYRPPYLPEPLSLYVGTNAGTLTEPLLFYLPFARRPDSHSTHQVREHPAGLREITRVEFVSRPAAGPSPAFKAVTNARLVRARTGSEYSVEIGFDGELKSRVADFRPALPLLFCW